MKEIFEKLSWNDLFDSVNKYYYYYSFYMSILIKEEYLWYPTISKLQPTGNTN